jgi:hypothetical protein
MTDRPATTADGFEHNDSREDDTQLPETGGECGARATYRLPITEH